MFPPVIAYYDGESYWLADGFRRLAAHKSARPGQPIFVEIRQGTRRDAVLCAVGSNASHGLRRTNEDKRNAVLTLLRDEEWGKWSNREVARVAQVSHPTVAALRSELASLVNLPVSDERTYTTKHGTVATMQTASIGASQTARPTARCARCGRELTDPASAQAGIGPCCARKPVGEGGGEGAGAEDELDLLARNRTPSGRRANALTVHISNTAAAVAEALALLEVVEPDAYALGLGGNLGTISTLLRRLQDALDLRAEAGE